MKIAKITPYVCYSPISDLVFVKVETDEPGLFGWGECSLPTKPHGVAGAVRDLEKLVVGADPERIEWIWQRMYRHAYWRGGPIQTSALSGIDMALWDIKGKHFGVSISTLLGGRFRSSIRAYATGFFKLDGVDRVEDAARQAALYRAEGFHATKVKIGFDPAEDLRVIAAVREAVGPDMGLMIDGNHGYDALEAINIGRKAAQYDIAWFEEPVAPEQLEAYQAVRQGQPIPLAAGETWHTRYGMRAPIEQRCVDIIQPDIGGCGGFTEARRIADLASLHSVRVVPHVWGTAVQIAAALQFMAAMVPDPVRLRPIEPILEFDRTDNPFRQAVVKTPLEPVNGVVTIPDGPGLGIEINRDALTHFAPR
jgi:D-galactarolactone cycloisomerase